MSFVAETIVARFSWSILLLLLLMLAVSATMFTLVVLRATSHRRSIALREWARANDFRRITLPAAIPKPLDRLSDLSVRPRYLLKNDRTTIVQFDSPWDDDVLVWNAMIFAIESEWPTTALRPVASARSLLDHFHLDSYAPLTSERFIIRGESILAARALADSSERALLPQDLGLLLSSRHLLIDFTSRPFDPIEFMRIIAMVEQLIAHLPNR